MQSEFQRDYSLDILKGIGILFVVFGHVTRIWPLHTYIWGFHMPLFFFVSGLLFDRERYGDFKVFLKSRVRRLILPYFFFSIINIGICYISIRTNPNAHDISLWKNTVGILYGNMNSVVGPLWFLSALFSLECMFYGLSNLKNWLLILFVSICFHIIGLFSIYTPFAYLPWSINLALIVMPIFAIGYIGKETCKKIDSLSNISKILIFIGSALVSYLLLPITGFDLSMHKFVNWYGYIPIALVGITTYLTLAKLLQTNKVLEWLGRNTIVIIALHGIVYQALIYLSSLTLGISMWSIRSNFLSCIAITILDVTILSPIIMIYNKMCHSKV